MPLGPQNDQGLAHLKTSRSVEQTIAAVESALKQHEVQLFARIDHQAAAAQAGLAMRPATVLIFGNPTIGTPMMAASPTLAIDLPFKLLVWSDASGQVWVTWNTVEYLAARHGLSPLLSGNLSGLVRLIRSAVGEK